MRATTPPPPPLFDGPLHPAGLQDVDLETLRVFGVEAALIAPLPTPAESAEDALGVLEALVEQQLPRLARADIRGFAMVGLSPRALPRRGLHEVLQALPGLFRGGRVVALGPLGLETGSEAELEALTEQLALARALEVPVVCTTPPPPLLKRLVSRLQASRLPERRILVSGLTLAGARVVRGCGFHAGLSLHPERPAGRARGESRCVRWGPRAWCWGVRPGTGGADLLALPRATHLLVKARLSEAVVSHVTALNLAAFLRVPAV